MTVQIDTEVALDSRLDYEAIAGELVEAAVLYENFPYEVEVNILITDNDGIQEINRETRGIDRPTDVLSFPMLEYPAAGEYGEIDEDEPGLFNPDSGELLLGDIVLSQDKIFEQAEAYGHAPRRELAFLLAHSMLHLFGYDHMEDGERLEMERRQEEILQSRGYAR